MALWHAYIVVPQTMEDEVRDLLKIDRRDWFWHVDKWTVLYTRTFYRMWAETLNRAYVPYAFGVFNDEEHQPRDRFECYYDRDGVAHCGRPTSPQDEQSAYYHHFKASGNLHNTRCYQMAFTLCGLNDWGDAKHNSAMAKMRAALTQ